MKKGWSIVGVIIGIVAIVVGICISCSSVRFGGDCYTVLSDEICTGFGWLIGLFGASDVCFFFGKIAEANKEN